MFEYGESVRVKSSGALGVICDVDDSGKYPTYIIDQQPYKKTNDADEWLLKVRENEIEPV